MNVLLCPDAGPSRLKADQSQHGLRNSCCDSMMADICLLSGPCGLKTRNLPDTWGPAPWLSC